MPDKVTYYAVVNDRRSRERPAGVFRRTYTEDGGRSDEAFTRNLRWQYSTTLISAERGDLDNEFIEITEDEANQIVEQIRARAADTTAGLAVSSMTPAIPGSRRRGIALRITAKLMLLVGFGLEAPGIVGVVYLAFTSSGNLPVRITLCLVLATAQLCLGRFLYRRGRRLDVLGRQYLSAPIDSPEELSPGSFVLYLRSFHDDLARQSEGLKGYGDESTRLQNFLLAGLTQEEQLVVALKPAGPVVAVGRPGERLPPVGARRIYLADDAWQDTVVDLMQKARLVVLALGPGASLQWELLQAVQVLPPNRLILLVLMPREAYLQFRASVASEFAATTRRSQLKGIRRPSSFLLPRHLPDPRPQCSEGWLIFFGGAKKATAVPLDMPLAPTLQKRRQFQKSISRALQPISLDRLASGEAAPWNYRSAGGS